MRVLHIPANPWSPAKVLDMSTLRDGAISLSEVAHTIGARTVEVLYPLTGSWLARWGGHVALGDEEGRLVDDPEPNPRATVLLGYPYPIVGDIAVIGDIPPDLRSSSSFCDADENLLPALQQPQGAFR